MHVFLFERLMIGVLIQRGGAGGARGRGVSTLNPKTRRLLRVDIADPLATDRVMAELMGKDASARFRFIMDRADQAQELDL